MGWTSNHPHNSSSSASEKSEENSPKEKEKEISQSDEPESVEFTPNLSQPSLLLTNTEFLKMVKFHRVFIEISDHEVSPKKVLDERLGFIVWNSISWRFFKYFLW